MIARGKTTRIPSIFIVSTPHPGQIQIQMILLFEQIKIQIVASLQTLNLPFCTGLFVYSDALSNSRVR